MKLYLRRLQPQNSQLLLTQNLFGIKFFERVNIIHRHNIFVPKISLRKFMISDSDLVPKLFGFSVTFDGKEYTTLEDREDYIKVGIAIITNELSQLGYVE
jgi:hypothetical protein